MNEDDCGERLIDSVVCGIGDAVGDAAGAVAGGAISAFVESVAESVETLLMVVSTTWMNIPSPVVAVGNEPTGVIAAISRDLSFYTLVFAMVGVLVAAAKVGLSGRGDAALPAVRMVITLVIVSAAGAATVSAAIAAGDAFAPWIIYRATGQDFSDGVVGILTAATISRSGVGVGLLVGVAALLGCIAQVVFMVFRGAMITMLMAVLPTIAATSATQGGSAALRKALGWLLAFVLYKPVAAVVYAVGFLLIQGYQAPGADDEQSVVMSMLMGLTIIMLAGLTLPALVKFLVPMASAGVSSMFSGAAVGVAALATGAAVVSMGGSAAAGGAVAKGAAPAAKTGASAATGAATKAPAATGAAGASGSGGGAAGGAAGGTGGAAPSPGGGGTPTGSAPGSGGGAAGEASPAGAASGGSGASSAPAAAGAPAASGGSANANAGAASATGSKGSAPAPAPAHAPTPAPAPAPRGAAPASGGRGAERWKSAARGAADAARSGTQAADEGGAGPSGAAVER